MTSSSGDWIISSVDSGGSSSITGDSSSITGDSSSSLISVAGVGGGVGDGLLGGGCLTTVFLGTIGLGALPNMSFGTALERPRLCTR